MQPKTSVPPDAELHGDGSGEALPEVPAAIDALPSEMTSAPAEESAEEKRLRWKRERNKALGGHG